MLAPRGGSMKAAKKARPRLSWPDRRDPATKTSKKKRGVRRPAGRRPAV